MLTANSSKRRTKAPVPFRQITEPHPCSIDHYTSPEEHTLEELRVAAANSNVIVPSDIDRDEAIKQLRGLGYCLVLTNENAGTFRVMKS